MAEAPRYVLPSRLARLHTAPADAAPPSMQRLARAIGKSRTMELTLTGRNWSAKEASDWGMVSRVVGEGEGEVVKEAVDLARVIASKSAIAVQANKEAVNAAFEHTLAEGLKYERRIFVIHLLSPHLMALILIVIAQR